jgi:hypothetical protein
MLERICVDHFEEDHFVARQPLAEDSIPFAVVHGFTFLDLRRVATDYRLRASTHVGSCHFDSVSSAARVFSYTQGRGTGCNRQNHPNSQAGAENGSLLSHL